MACFQKEAKGLGKASKLISSESFWLRVRSEKREVDAGLGPVQMQKKKCFEKNKSEKQSVGRAKNERRTGW